MTAPLRFALVAFLGASACLFTSTARASESYPEAIERALDTPCPPACTTCHTSASGGELTANTPFGISARRAGLHCCDTSELLDVLATMESSGTDSDTDGTPDIEELRAGTDPNAPEGKLDCYVPPEDEGCAIGHASAFGGRGSAWVFGPVLAVVVLARLRRRGRRGQSQ